MVVKRAFGDAEFACEIFNGKFGGTAGFKDGKPLFKPGKNVTIILKLITKISLAGRR